ncbi:MAG: CPXCG motif-containing cysteine-rich protein [Pseudomonadota bacterium]|nr:CPXCG motif-containing cysteine-rich protein [Pseudomonadota bacterium]
MVLEESNITCPFCWQNLEITLDLSIDDQEYIEDCQVCCNPINIICSSKDGKLIKLVAQNCE